MKKTLMAWLMAFLLIGVVSAQAGTGEERVIADGALPLLRTFACAITDSEAPFLGEPSQELVWRALSCYVSEVKAGEGPTFTEAQVADFYRALFSEGEMMFYNLPVGDPWLPVNDEHGFTFQFGDGDAATMVAINRTRTIEGGIIEVDLTKWRVGQQGEEIFEYNAVAMLRPNAKAEYGARMYGFKVQPATKFNATVQASATRAAQSGNTYAAGHVLDGNLETCWAVDMKKTARPSLQLTLKKAAAVRGMEIVPGYAKSEYAYRTNRRASTIEVTIDGGKPMRYELEDFDANAFDAARKVLLFDGVAMAKTIKIEFVDTYPGERYHDLCISEIGLF